MNCLTGKTRGTCDDEACKLHGICHCGCGRTTNIAAKADTRYERTRNRPVMFVHRHNPSQQRLPRNTCRPENGHVHDVPLADLWYEWTLLSEAYPATRDLARVLGVNRQQIGRYQHGVVTNVSRRVAAQMKLQARALNRCVVKVPVAPLSEFMYRRGVDLHSLGEREERAYYRWRADGRAPLMRVDQLCCEALGVHPFVVYGPSWFTFGEELEEASA
jgi:hypothetical protein